MIEHKQKNTTYDEEHSPGLGQAGLNWLMGCNMYWY